MGSWYRQEMSWHVYKVNELVLLLNTFDIHFKQLLRKALIFSTML